MPQCGGSVDVHSLPGQAIRVGNVPHHAATWAFAKVHLINACSTDGPGACFEKWPVHAATALPRVQQLLIWKVKLGVACAAERQSLL